MKKNSNKAVVIKPENSEECFNEWNEANMQCVTFENMSKDMIERALIKKALGYIVEETTEEYCEEGKVASKKKVTQKHVSSDLSAIKLLLDLVSKKNDNDLSNLSDEEILKLREIYLGELKNGIRKIKVQNKM